MWQKALCVVLLFVGQVAVCQAFNVDTRSAVIRHGDPGSMFGFTVAQHRDQGQSWLLVGAPRAQTAQPNVVRGGHVYRCRVDQEQCEHIPFDDRGSNIQWNGSDFVNSEDKSHQWFGASLYSSADHDVVVACAPRYVYFSLELNKREPVGTCWVATSNTRKFTEYSPCRTEVDWYTLPDQVSRQSHCMAGMAVTLSKDGTRLVMGAVGSWYWQGQVFSQSLSDEYDIYETPEMDAAMDDTYLGYAVATGEFTGDDSQDYVVGTPKGAGLKGMVSIFAGNLTVLAYISGEQIGEYFGSALAVADFNGDGYDDMAVGAPFHSNGTSDTYECGCVYVYYQSGDHIFKQENRVKLYGTGKYQSRFGFSLTALGDINNDAFQDLAVGSPYDGENEKGAVYIFHGSLTGIISEPSQVISASQLGTSLSTFGYSVSGGTDLDANVYPDLLVGAFQSDQAVLLKSRPVIRVDAEVILQPRIMDLEERHCVLTDGTRVVCVSIITCVTFTGLKVPGEIELSMEWRLDAKKSINTRLLYITGSERETIENATMVVQKKGRECRTAFAYLKNSIHDKLSPLAVEMRYQLIEKPPTSPEDLTPILDQYIPKLVTGEGQILKNCGPDNVCIPDLRIQGNSLNPYYVIGTSLPLELSVTLINSGEDSFESQVKIQMPPGVNYININNVQSPEGVSCLMQADQDVLLCAVGNPLPAASEASFVLRVSAENMNTSLDVLRFLLQANSSNPENYTDIANNFALVDVAVKVITDLQLTGVSRPEQVLYNDSLGMDIEAEEDIGPEVIHLYEVRNLGPSSVTAVNIEIYWPSDMLEFGALFYLLEIPTVVQGNGTCTAWQVNANNVTVQNREVSYTSELIQELKEQGRRRAKRDLREPRRARKTLTNYECQPETEWCTTIRCEIGHMDKDDTALVEVRGRLWKHTLIKAKLPAMFVSSLGIVQVMEVPYAVGPEDYSLDTYQVKTFVASRTARPGRRPIEMWVIILAVVGGFLLLLLLTLLLYRCGFFIRKRIPKDPEYEKLPQHRVTVVRNGLSVASHYEQIPNDEL